MNLGFSVARISAHFSAGRCSWIVSGSRGLNASSINSCARRQSFSALGPGELTKTAPRYNSFRRSASRILESTKIFIELPSGLSHLLRRLLRTASASIDRRFRYRYDELATPLADELQLPHDLVFQIPRQDHDVVGLGLSDPIRVENRDVSARQESTLFVRAPVHGVLDQIFADAAVMQQSCALAGCSVSRHRLALPRRSEQELHECDFGLLYLLRKTLIAHCRSQPRSFFLGDQFLDSRFDLMCSVFCTAGINPQGAAVG